MSTAPPSLRPRPSRTIPALILGIVLLAAGGILTWVLGAYAIDGSWPAQARTAVDAVAGESLGAPLVLTIGIVVGVLGLVLLLAGILPGSRRRSLLRSDAGSVPGETVVAHRDLARRLRTRLERVDGVSGAHVEVTDRRVRASIATPVDDRTAVDSRARRVAEAELAELSLGHVPTLRLTTRAAR